MSQAGTPQAQDYLRKDTQYIFMSIPTDAVPVEAMLNYAKKTCLGSKVPV